MSLYNINDLCGAGFAGAERIALTIDMVGPEYVVDGGTFKKTDQSVLVDDIVFYSELTVWVGRELMCGWRR